uniref:Uncharacterized protein n=1 Tax=viral metagenome TaxID=1070528 RepID=A0A6M3LEK3_9ZZZZ
MPEFPTHYFNGHGGSMVLCRKLTDNLVQVCCDDGMAWNPIPLHVEPDILFPLSCKVTFADENRVLETGR